MENNNTQTNYPTPNNVPTTLPPTPAKEHTANNENTIIVVVLAIIVVVLALMYIWGSRVGESVPEPQPLPVEMAPSELPATSNSDAVQDLETDLTATDVDSLGSELDELEVELDATLNVAP